jgi:uncharacterized MAPEG superfamily protein
LDIELHMLVWSVVLGLVHIVTASHAASLQHGYRWTASARDQEVASLTGVAGRLDRALRNFSETFPLFATLVFAAHAVGGHNALTESGAVLYFVARLAYLPLYALGVPLVRSLVWNVAALGMTLMLVALLWKPAG